jgi:tetratricopeptide (TPR) repeat protein
MLGLRLIRPRETVISRADRALRAGEREVALSLYRRALDRNPRNAPIWVQCGHVLKETGRLAEAEAAYRQAVAHDPQAADPYLHLGHALKLQGREQEAEAAYVRAFALDPASPDAAAELRACGWTTDRLAQLAEAVRVPSASRPASPSRAIAAVALSRRRAGTITLADRARDVGDWASAARFYRKALDRRPQNPPIWVQYGHALKEMGRLAEAEGAYRMAVAHDPSAAESWLQLGHALKLQTRNDAAEAAYLRAVALGPALLQPLDELRACGWSHRQAGELGAMLRGDGPAPLEAERGSEKVRNALQVTGEAVKEPDERDALAARFDRDWYLRRYPDVGKSGLDALEHFIKHGRFEGRAGSPAELRYSQTQSGPRVPPEAGAWTPVTDAAIHCLKHPERADELALFVTHSPRGRLQPHVGHYLRSLGRQGISVVLIVAADQPFSAANDELMQTVEGLFVRENKGFDFAAWTHVLLLYPQLLDASILYLLNDSVIGPVNDFAFADILAAVRKDPADVVGLTENLERSWHIQSYFLALKSRVLASVAFNKFLTNIVAYEDKEDVINQYEIRFASDLIAAGYTCKTLFRDYRTPTIFHWRYLLDCGFPFVKTTTLTGVHAVDIGNWQQALASRDYDASLAEKTLAERPGSPAPRTQRTGVELVASHDLAELSSATPKAAFIGPWNYDNGLGAASRGYVAALRHTPLLLNLLPIKRPLHIHNQLAPAVDVCEFSGMPDVAIIHYNPDGWPGLLTQAQQSLIDQARLTVGQWVWEMTEIPDVWLPGFERVDAVWAPSRYCADIFATVAQVPVQVVPHVVPVPPVEFDAGRVAALRRELGLAEDERVILYAFDGSSYVVRKNPAALVRAFVRSGLAGRGWRLVLKAKHLFDREAEGRRFQQEVEQAQGAILVDRSVDRAAMDGLLRLCDIYASPHCSEGFGLTIAEAMARGKIAVATDYAGSRDFLDAACGFPVRYRMKPLDDDYGHYTRDGGAWAAIDEDHLTESLLQAAAMVEAGDRSVGEAARRRIAERLSPSAVGATMRDSLRQLMQSLRRKRQAA